MMQISDDTIEVLKNFGTINPSLSFKAGNTVRTVSEQKNILAQAEIGETLPVNFAIYELNQFLGLASLYDKPDFAFGEKEVILSEGNNKSNIVRVPFHYSFESILCICSHSIHFI